MDSKRIDRSLLLTGVVLILISSYQLFFADPYERSLEAIGRLSSTSSIVKTKNALALDWRDAFLGTEVAENQLLYTDQNSSAEVVFLSGSALRISENSLVKLTTVRNTEGVNLNRGLVTARVRGEHPLSVDLNGEEFVLSGDDADIQLQMKTGRGEIGVLSGEINVTRDGKEESLTTDSMILIEGKEARKVNITFQVLSPSREEILTGLDERIPVTFEWEPAQTATLIVDSDLNPIERTAESGETILLPEGQYTWRVRSAEGQSLSSSFKVIQETSPVILRPREGESLELLYEKVSTSVLLQWKGKGDKYLVQWQERGELHEREVNTTQFRVPVSFSGDFLWRVKASGNDRPLAQWSEWQRIEINLIHPPLVPQDLFPHQVEFQLFQKDGVTVDLSWSSSLVERELIHPDGTTKSAIIQGTREDLVLSRPGRYQWRVRARDQYQRLSQWSDWKVFDVVDLSHDVAEGAVRIQLKRPDQEVTFEWEAENIAQSVFELASDKGFQDIRIRQEVQGRSARVLVEKIGTYFWRSRQYFSDGKIHVSEPKRVIIEPVAAPGKPATPPDLELPLEFKTKSSSRILDLIFSQAWASDLMGQVLIQIPSSDIARAYILRIYQSNNQLLIEKEVTDPEFLWTSARPGEYRWEYAVIDHWNRRSPFSDPAVLVIKNPGPGRPLLLHPIRAKEVKRESLRFDWSKADRTQLYQLMVSRNPDLSDPILSVTTKNDEFTPKNMKAGAGLHYWQVTAKDAEGGEHLSSVGRFTLLAEDPPKIAKPSEKAVRVFRHRGQLSWSPSQDNYQFKSAGRSGKISGTALMSIKGTAHLFFDSWVLGAEILRQTGKVFEKQDYLLQKLQLDASYKFSHGNHLLAPGIYVGQFSGQEYVLDNDEVKGSSVSSLSYGAGIKGFHSLSPQWEVESRVSYMLGDVSELEVAANLLRHFSSYYGVLGVGIINRSYSGASGEQTSLQMSVGLGKEF